MWDCASILEIVKMRENTEGVTQLEVLEVFEDMIGEEDVEELEKLVKELRLVESTSVSSNHILICRQCW